MTPNNLNPAELYQNALQALNQARDEYIGKERYIDALVARVQQLENQLRDEYRNKEGNIDDLLVKLKQQQERIDQLEKQLQKYSSNLEGGDLENRISSLRSDIENGAIVAGKAFISERPLIQSGSEFLPYAEPGGKNLPSFMCEGTGPREHLYPVQFPVEFSNTPKIILALNALNIVPAPLIYVDPTNATRLGFNILVRTWGDTKIYAFTVHWMAYL